MATTRVAAGQITIVDLNDGKAVQATTSTSRGDTQIYVPDTKTYTPSWAASPYQVVTAHVYVTGSSTDQAPLSACSGWTWKVNGAEVTSSTANYAAASNALTVKANIGESVNILNIEWGCTYTDPDTGAATTVSGYKTLTLSKSGGAALSVQITQSKGNTFDAGTGTSSLTAEARFYRGGTQDTAVTSMTWYKLDISTAAWNKVSSNVSTSSGVSTITVTRDDVQNFQTYKCEIVDGSDQASQIVTFFDATDDCKVEMYTTTGDKIVNGTGSTTVYARIWRGDTQITDLTGYTFKWTKYDKDGKASNWSGTTSSVKTTTGSTNYVTVTADDVTVRCTVCCEVSK